MIAPEANQSEEAWTVSAWGDVIECRTMEEARFVVADLLAVHCPEIVIKKKGGEK